MAAEMRPEDVLVQLKRGRLAPFYLFYGPSEFRLEKVLGALRETFIPASARDFNLQLFYGDEADPGEIVEAGRSLPFMSQNRLIIVRRTESFSASKLESLLPYLEDPVPSTCMIFVSSKTDFKRKFFRKFKETGTAVNFKTLGESQIGPWIKRTAKELGLKINDEGCAFLQQIAGSRLRDLYGELEKLRLRYGSQPIGAEEVQELAIRSRTFTIFELVDQVSSRRCRESMSVLDRFLEEQDREAVLGVLGMLTRQVRLMWQARSMAARGERAGMAKKLGVPDFLVPRIMEQARHWSSGDLERAFQLLYEADGLLKRGSNGRLVLENLVLSLCG